MQNYVEEHDGGYYIAGTRISLAQLGRRVEGQIRDKPGRHAALGFGTCRYRHQGRFSHRPWHPNVRCEWNGIALVLTVENGYDSDGGVSRTRLPMAFRPDKLEMEL
jgi:hypothetical protein